MAITSTTISSTTITSTTITSTTTATSTSTTITTNTANQQIARANSQGSGEVLASANKLIFDHLVQDTYESQQIILEFERFRHKGVVGVDVCILGENRTKKVFLFSRKKLEE